MEFWSKGLGTKTLELRLLKGRTLRNEDVIYLEGRLEAPVSWDYIMPMRGDDVVDFFELLREPALARYVHGSPQRGRILLALMRHGVALAGLVVLQTVRSALGLLPPAEHVALDVPPASVLEKKKRKKAAEATPARKPYRRRLAHATTSAPSLTSAMREQLPLEEDPEALREAIDDAMEAASQIGE